MHYSSNLEKHERTDIGLQFISKVSSSFLQIGDTFATFDFSGNIPFCNERLKIYFKGVKNVSEVSFIHSKKYCHAQDFD